MYAPGQDISRYDRQRAVEFVRGLSDVSGQSGITECITAILNSDFQIQCSTPPSSGVPVIARIDLPLGNDSLREYSRQLAALLCDRISEKFHNINCLVSETGQSNRVISELADMTLKGSGAAMAQFSREHGMELETLAFFSVYLARPFRKAVAKLAADRGALSEWTHGYCPACGLWARMGQIDAKEGYMQLWCIGCDHRWRFPRLCCPFCLERRPEQLGFLRVDESDRFRVYTCDSCHRYLKTVTTPKNESVDFDVEYLSSSRFDVTAAFEKYVQDFVGFAAFDMKDNAASQAYRKRALS